jgi:O-antigen ligase
MNSVLPRLRQTALGATLLLPAFFFYGRAIADGLLSLTAILFLVHSAISRDWRWTKKLWVQLSLLLWLLILLSSIVSGKTHSSLEALVLVRLFIFAAALESWLLVSAKSRSWLGIGVAIAAIWLVVECWQQYIIGHNILGDARWPDGSLTGPFFKPRAGPQFLLVFFTGLMPVVVTLIQRQDWLARIGGAGTLIFLVLTMILIGQRMPNLLMVFGLCLSALLVKQFRVPFAIAIAIGIVALIALPVISPPTYAKLIVKFTSQMSHFPRSPYGQLYTRAAVMVVAHPWLGLGFDGFRDFCTNPAYFHGFPALGIPNADNGGLRGCNIHPHNYYLQIATSAGVPGLLVFLAMAGLWLHRMIRRVSPGHDPRQAMLTVACCVILWPMASTSSLFTLSTAGWVFMTIGWSLAASAPPSDQTG